MNKRNNYGFPEREKVSIRELGIVTLIAVVISIAVYIVLFACVAQGRAEQISGRTLTASWYSVASLKKEGTWKTSHGVMANGKEFRDENITCATRLYSLGSWVTITNVQNGRNVRARVTDRIGKRFAKTRIDLSKAAFSRIASLSEGLVKVEVTNE